MNRRVKPCPEFPKRVRDYEGGYTGWRMAFVHWVWTLRRAMICESLMSTSFMEAMKGGDAGVHEQVIMIDPRILGNPGRPVGTYGPQDPGQLSGVVWFVESHMDRDHGRRITEEGQQAIDAHYAVKRDG